jgi:hypothetical protein
MQDRRQACTEGSEEFVHCQRIADQASKVRVDALSAGRASAVLPMSQGRLPTEGEAASGATVGIRRPSALPTRDLVGFA